METYTFTIKPPHLFNILQYILFIKYFILDITKT
jgi:hypothetical protein